MRCLNHPKDVAPDVCAICGNPFCNMCLENAGEHKICLDCIQATAERSLEIRDTSFISKRLMFAGFILFFLGILVILNNIMRAFDLIQTVFLGASIVSSVLSETVHLSLEGFKAFIYLSAGYGVLMSRPWSYWLGLAISVGIIIYELYNFWSIPTRISLIVLAASASTLLLIATSRRF